MSARKPKRARKASSSPASASDIVLVLRTVSSDGRSHNGFRHPLAVGEKVEAPDWNAEPICGGGIHGLLWGEGAGELLSWEKTALWQVYEVDPAEGLVEIDQQKCKFRRGTLVHLGDQASATAFILERGAKGRAVVGAVVAVGGHRVATAGDGGQATAGYGGQATAGDGGQATAGDGGQATAGDSGQATAGDSGQATAGNSGQATAGDGGQATAGDGGQATAGYGGQATAGYGGQATAGYGGQATAGNSGQATAGNSGQATAGYGGQATAGDSGRATAGDSGQARAGDLGAIAVGWWDQKARRMRLTVGYVGENGIKPNTFYRCDKAGNLVEVVA